MTDLSDTLKKLRFNRFKQDEVAKKIGVSTRTYARFESGENKVSLELCVKLANLYKLTVDELLNYGDPDYVLNEPKSSYQKKWNVPITINLDGTSETLEMWISKLTAINAAI